MKTELNEEKFNKEFFILAIHPFNSPLPKAQNEKEI